MLNGEGRWRGRGENEVDVQADQLSCQIREALNLPFRRSVFDENMLPLHISVFAQSLPKGIERRLRLGRFKRTCYQITDSCCLRGLLAVRSRGPRDGTHKRDELPPLHSTPRQHGRARQGPWGYRWATILHRTVAGWIARPAGRSGLHGYPCSASGLASPVTEGRHGTLPTRQDRCATSALGRLPDVP